MEQLDPIDNLVKSVEYIREKDTAQMRLIHGDDADTIVAKMRAEQAARREREQAHRWELLKFTASLSSRILNNPTTLAVYQLHAPDGDTPRLNCSHCFDGHDGYTAWPCDTIKTIARALNVEVPTA